MRGNAIIITYPDEFAKNEVWELAKSADYNPIAIFTSKELGGGRLGVPHGKAEYIKEQARQLGADVVIVDESVKAAQAYRLQKFTGVERVVDRIRLVLDIFERRANTTEAKLQVKLAELKYEIPRVREIVRLTKMGEQTGFYGYGAYAVDKYIRSLNRQMHSIIRKLDDLRSKKENIAVKRRNSELMLVALAGYSGAGKTTLFNALTSEEKPVTGRYFTTLSTVTRKINGFNNVLLSDTVGFITRLPPFMIESFKSTLSEIEMADLVLLLLDSTLSPDKARVVYSESMKILAGLGVPQSRTIVVFTKFDKASQKPDIPVDGTLGSIEVSAVTGFHLEELKELIRSFLPN